MTSPDQVDRIDQLVLSIYGTALTDAATQLRAEYTAWTAENPDKATADVTRGYMLAMRRLDVMAQKFPQE